MNTNIAIKKTMDIGFCSSARIKCVAREDMPRYGLVKGQRFHLVRVRETTYKVKAIKVLSRSVNGVGDVTSRVENYDGQKYTTTLRRNKLHSCSCPAKGECYHIDILRYVENRRVAKMIQMRKAAEVAPLNGNRPFGILKAA
jgi:hypothetical protein